MTRLLSGLILLAVVLGVLFWLPPWGTLMLALVAGVLGCLELAALAAHGHEALPRGLMVLASAAVTTAMALPERLPPALALLACVVGIGVVLVGEGRADMDVPRRVGVTLLPVLYVGLPLGALVAVRRESGAGILLLLLATTVVSDTAQYYGGRLLGRRPLAPRVSPKKTVEGAVSGFLVGSLVLPLAGGALLPGVPTWLLWLVGLALVGLGIVGDLFESLLKRSVGVKDASGLIPGHGGVLDRLDSLLFAGPFYYGFLQALG